MNMIAGITDIASNAGSFNLSFDELVRITVPKFTPRDLTKLRRDCEILLERLKSNPEKFQQFVKSANSGDLLAAQAIAKELKLTESDFEKEGGGCIWVLVIIIILLCTKSAK